MKINAKNYEYNEGKLQIYYNIFECNAFIVLFHSVKPLMSNP